MELFKQMFEEATNKSDEIEAQERGTTTGTTERWGGEGLLEKVSVDLNFAALFTSVQREAFLRR